MPNSPVNAIQAPLNAAATEREPFWSGRRKRLYGAVALAAAVYAGATSLHDWRDSHTLLINTSPSLPNWAFVLDHTHPPVRGSAGVLRPAGVAIGRSGISARIRRRSASSSTA